MNELEIKIIKIAGVRDYIDVVYNDVKESDIKNIHVGYSGKDIKLILDYFYNLEHNWNELKKWLLCMREVSHLDINCLNATLDKMQSLEERWNNE